MASEEKTPNQLNRSACQVLTTKSDIDAQGDVSSVRSQQRTGFKTIKVEIEWRIEKLDKLLVAEQGKQELDSKFVQSPLVPELWWNVSLDTNPFEQDHTGIYVCRSGEEPISPVTATCRIQFGKEDGGFVDVANYTARFGAIKNICWGHGNIPNNKVREALHADGSLLVLSKVEFLWPESKLGDAPERVPDLPPSQPINHPLAKLLEDGTNSDLVVKVGYHQLKAHRAILAAHSDAFKAMFARPEYSEASGGELTIEDFPVATVKALLRFIYSGAVDPGNEPGAEQCLLQIADKYQVLPLKEAVGRLLKANLTTSNFFELAELADTHSCPELKRACARYFRPNSTILASKSGQWKALKRASPEFAMELMEHAMGMPLATKRQNATNIGGSIYTSGELVAKRSRQ